MCEGFSLEDVLAMDAAAIAEYASLRGMEIVKT